ncbi:MAG: hypothetical protein UZ20_WS6002000039 [candidate division WS6 bacterium OLB21]|uniref:Uncharacterized protein n=1 Tax=candidate division WS6 bacterium OLB21 TaxID=1617427 RepID=A0A136KL16_9BACT|nr:MAG: hypothetical protein UZ20_WS6002000039 [candidate division WS6 bacterium OLB21]
MWIRICYDYDMKPRIECFLGEYKCFNTTKQSQFFKIFAIMNIYGISQATNN